MGLDVYQGAGVLVLQEARVSSLESAPPPFQRGGAQNITGTLEKEATYTS